MAANKFADLSDDEFRGNNIIKLSIFPHGISSSSTNGNDHPLIPI